MKEKRVWIGLAVLFAIIGVPQLFWKPSRFGGIFPARARRRLHGGVADAARTRESTGSCRVLARVGQRAVSAIVRALVCGSCRCCIIGVAFEEDDPAAAPQADYYLALGALVNPDGQPSAALAARCDTAIARAERQSGQSAPSCAAVRAAMSRAPKLQAMQDYMIGARCRCRRG